MTNDLPVILDVGQLEALLRKTFNIGLDVGRGREKVDLVRLRLARLLKLAELTAASGRRVKQDLN